MNHTQARQIILRAWQRVHGRAPSASEAEGVQAVAWGESQYGRAGAWGNSGQHARWAAQGLFTWGNLETLPNKDGSCPAGTYPGTDSGEPRCFYLDTSDEDAAVRYIRNLTASGNASSTSERARAFAQRTANVMSALQNTDSSALANAMVTPSSVAYYEATPASYAKLLDSSRAAIRKELGSPAPSPAPFPVVVPDRSSLLPLALAALAVGGLYYLGVRERIVPPPTRLLRVARRMA